MRQAKLRAFAASQVEFSMDLIVEILAAEVRHRAKNVPDLHITSLVGRVLGEELLEGDEALEQLVLDRVIELSQVNGFRPVTPKSKVLWATRPDAENPRRRVAAVHTPRSLREQLVLLTEPELPQMLRNGLVLIP
jgi:hypothetical protein